MWSTEAIADAVFEGLVECAHADDLEQAVYGFDALDELKLHPIIQESLRRAGYGVWPEQRYPGAWNRAKRSEGRRCDIVLTMGNRTLRNPDVKATLFDTPDACDADEAYWLEVKSVAQHERSGPFPRYSAELLSPVADDVKKLLNDGVIRWAGLLLVLFTEDRTIAEHDVEAWHKRCVEKALPVSRPALRGLAINNRIGNGWCAAAVIGVRG